LVWHGQTSFPKLSHPSLHPQDYRQAEHIVQTLMREWAYAIPFGSSQARAADLPRWLTWYNQQRSHDSLSRRAPAQALAATI